jgi:hypothetical protein
VTDTELTDARRRLRDQLWITGPHHYDLDELFTVNGEAVYSLPEGYEADGAWTACLIGHTMLAVSVLDGWHSHKMLPDFNVYDAMAGDPRWTWAGVIDELDRLIKDADNEVTP